MATKQAKYGYIIAQTPGLVQDGSFPLAATAIKNNEIKIVGPCEDVAVWATKEEAEAVIMALTPEGISPAAYAAIHVEPTYTNNTALERLIYGQVEGMGGFVVPAFEG